MSQQQINEEKCAPSPFDYGTVLEDTETSFYIELDDDQARAYALAWLDYLGLTYEELKARADPPSQRGSPISHRRAKEQTINVSR